MSTESLHGVTPHGKRRALVVLESAVGTLGSSGNRGEVTSWRLHGVWLSASQHDHIDSDSRELHYLAMWCHSVDTKTATHQYACSYRRFE